MTYYFSVSKNQFISDQVHAEIPEDAVQISDDKYQKLILDQSNGKILYVDNTGALQSKNPPSVTAEQIVEKISSSITKALDDGARKWGYNNLAVAASYVSSGIPQYAADSKSLIEWRDTVWTWAIPKFSSVNPDQDVQEFIKNMPAQPIQPTA